MLKFISYNNKNTNNLNVGDINCSPHLYFNFKNYALEDICTYDPIKEDICIIGGGGLLCNPQGQDFNKYLNCNKKIIWGAGINTDDVYNYKLEPSLSSFDLVGIRDNIKYHSYNFLPCVSCMHPAFSKSYEIKHDIVVYEHYDNPIDLKYPKLTNKGEYIEEKINFLASSNYVITNTYHGMYWAALLKKKVLIYNPFSSRFLNTQFELTCCNQDNYVEQMKECKVYDLLYKYRQLNIEFFETVKLLINVHI
jgi:hypothetical protein